MRRRFVTLAAGLVALSGFVSSCSALKDPEPFLGTVTYNTNPSGSITVQPLRIEGDASFGQITVANQTNQEHGFAVRELSVFEKIPKDSTRIIDVTEAKDDMTYTFECQIHDGEFTGTLVINYVTEKERR